MNEEREQPNSVDSPQTENSFEKEETVGNEAPQADEGAADNNVANAVDDTANEKSAESAPIEEDGFFKKKKRNGIYVSKLNEDTLKNLQKRKAMYMYLSTVLYLFSMLVIPTEGRQKLIKAVENGTSYGLPLSTLYLGVCLLLFVYTVYIVIMSSTWQRIKEEHKESNIPKGGLDKHTFISYEIFNALHVLLAAGEIALVIYGFDWWGLFNAFVAVLSAVLCFMSRQILFKANANNLIYVSEEELEKMNASANEPKKSKKKR